MSPKECFIVAYEQLSEEFDREPTAEEVEERSTDLYARQIDDAVERAEDENLNRA